MCFLKDAFSVNDRTKIVHINNNQPIHNCSNTKLPRAYDPGTYPALYSGGNSMTFYGNSPSQFCNDNLSPPSYSKINNYHHHSCINQDQDQHQNQSTSTINLESAPSIEFNPNLDFAPVNYNTAQSRSAANNANNIRNYDKNYVVNRADTRDIRDIQNIQNKRLDLHQHHPPPPRFHPPIREHFFSPLMQRHIGLWGGRLAGFGPYMQQQEQDRGRRRLLDKVRYMDQGYDYNYRYPDYEDYYTGPAIRSPGLRSRWQRRPAVPMHNPWEDDDEDEDDYSDYDDDEMWPPWMGRQPGLRSRQASWGNVWSQPGQSHWGQQLGQGMHNMHGFRHLGRGGRGGRTFC